MYKHALVLVFEHLHTVRISCFEGFLELEHMTLWSIFLFHLQIDVFLKKHLNKCWNILFKKCILVKKLLALRYDT